MNPANKIKSIMSGKDNNCSLCRSNDGLLTTIGSKQYKNIQDKLLRVLRAKDDLNSKIMCHKCIFKLEVVSQFCSQEATYNKKCIKCGNEGHEDLKITSPLILNKLRFVECNLQIDKKHGLLCAACYYKLELLKELKIYITLNTFQASLGNDIGNVITNSERIFTVETLECCGMVKVTEEVRNDEKTYSSITQVNIPRVDGYKPKTTEVPMKIDRTPEVVPVEKPKSLKKEKEVKHIVKIKIRGKNDLVKQSSSPEVHVENITKETPKKRGRPAKANQLMKKQKIEDPKDDEGGDIILHNKKPIKVPVIILKRTNLKTPQKTSPRKRALKSVNESNDDKDAAKILKFEHEVVIEVNDAELKENVPEDSGNVSRDSDDVPKEILNVEAVSDSDEDMPLDDSAQSEVIFDSLFDTSDTNEKPEDKKIPDVTSPKKIISGKMEKKKLEIIDDEEKPVVLCNNKEDSDVMTLSDDEEDATEKPSQICEDDKDDNKNNEAEQASDNEEISGITDVTEEENKESTDVEKMETSETLALIAEHIKLTEEIESKENTVENEEKEQSDETDEPAVDNMKEKSGNGADESLVEDIDKVVIVGDLPDKVLADELPEDIITEQLPEKLLAEEEISENASKDEKENVVVEDQILENVSENGFSSTEEDDEIKFKDSEKIAPINNSVKTVPSPQLVV